MMNEKMEALRMFLGYDSMEDITESTYDENTFDTPDGEYMVLTDEEADEKADEYINDSVWAFNTNFIIEHSEVLDFDKASEQIVSAIQQQCESGNDAMKKLIDDMDEFVSDAISYDGRGHFLNTYDGEENEQSVNDTMYFIYRMN